MIAYGVATDGGDSWFTELRHALPVGEEVVLVHVVD